jgi:ribosomal protein L11 methyltransferase
VSADYWSLDVVLDPAATDAVGNFLTEAGAAGVVEETNHAAVRLRAFFPPGTDAAVMRERLTRYLGDLRALAIPVGPGTLTVARVLDEAWAEAWRAHFRPVAIGRRLLVCPPWDVPTEPAGRTRVLIEPGRAFGTGSHATTRACLELLERALERASVAHVLDVGTGSGILAVAAARLGVAAVTALDPDPDAVAAAAENAARNGVTSYVRAELAAVEEWSGPPAPLVLANLLGPALVRLAPVLARVTTRPGQLVVGGLLDHEAAAVIAAHAPEGFALVEAVEREGWAGLLLSRGDAPVPGPA